MIDSTPAINSITMQSNTERTANHNNNDKLFKINPHEIQLNMNIHEDDLKRAVESVNKDFKADDKRLEYTYHKETKTYVIKVIDGKTDEVIKQIPSQKLLDYASGLMEHIGIIVDSKV